MHRRIAAGVVAAAALTLGAAATPASAAGTTPVRAAAAPTSPPTAADVPAEGPASGPATPTPPNAKAWVLVDADTGAVIAGYNDHTPMRPASITKILTGLIAIEALPPDATVPVGPDAQGTEAAKINMKAGQVWPLGDTLHALLMVSANDAAVALADKIGGSEQGFVDVMDRVLQQLRTVDTPVFNDPAGLDDSFAFEGGNQVSAYDMAIITRAAMALPEFRTIVATPEYRFVGPDGVHHVLHNHNKLLLWDPTVIGVKPGFTRHAGETFVTEATRNGRSMLVVELGASPAAMYSGAEALFQQGFATPVDAEPTGDHLPAVVAPDPSAQPAAAPARSAPPRSLTRAATVQRTGAGIPRSRVVVAVLVLLTGALLWRRRTVNRRRLGRLRPTATARARRAQPAVGRRYDVDDVGAVAADPYDAAAGDPFHVQLMSQPRLFDQDGDQSAARNRNAASMQR